MRGYDSLSRAISSLREDVLCRPQNNAQPESVTAPNVTQLESVIARCREEVKFDEMHLRLSKLEDEMSRCMAKLRIHLDAQAQVDSVDLERKFIDLLATRRSEFDLSPQNVHAREMVTTVDLPVNSQQKQVTLASEINKAIEEESCHHVAESTWESVLCVWSPMLSCGASFSVCFAALLNMAIQCTFVLIVAVSFGDGDVTMDKQQAREFRRNLGHDYQKMDTYHWVSLASRVCASDETLEIASGQVRLVSTIDNYLGVDVEIFGQEGIPVGLILCTVVLLVWVMSTMSEMRAIFSFALALCGIPRNWSVGTRLEVDDDGMFVLTCTTITRCSILFAMTFVRAFIVVCLMIYGTVFIASTASLQDLVLNGVALLFVMDVDELVFKGIASMEIQSIIRRLKPISRTAGMSLKRYHVTSIATVTFSTLVTVWAALGSMWDTYDTLREIREELCLRGPLDFVIGVSPLGTANVGKSNPYDRKPAELGLVAWVADEIIQGMRPINWPSRAMYSNLQGVAFGSQVSTYTVDKFVREADSSSCQDITPSDPSHSSYSWKAAAHMVGKLNATTCSEMSSLCAKEEGGLVRALCGKTCGCDSAKSGLSDELPGCLKSCKILQQTEFEQLECKASDGEAMAEAVKKSMDKIIDEGYVHAFAAKPRNVWMKALDDSLQGGCNGVQQFLDGIMQYGFYELFCLPLYGLALSTFCPEQCTCFLQQIPNCPTSCCKDQDELLGNLGACTNLSSIGLGCNDVEIASFCPATCGLCPNT